MNKKILSVTSFILGQDAATWRVLNIARALREKGHVVDIVQYIGNNHPSKFEIQSIDFAKIPNKVVKLSRPSTILYHLNYIIKNNYDLVIGNEISGALYSLLGRIKIPLLLDMHGDLVEELKMNSSILSGSTTSHSLARLFLYKVAALLSCNLSNKIFCVSHKMMNSLNKKGVPKEKLVYVPNCVDLDFFSPLSPNNQRVISLKRELGISDDKMVFGYVGRFHKWQGVESFINAGRKIKDDKVVFLIVGANKAGREGNIIFISEVPIIKIPIYYSLCDVLVLPRPTHPATEVAAPTKFAEYAAMGKPILTTNVGDAADFVRKYNCGVVVNNNSVGELINGIMRIRETTSETQTTMGKSARLLAQKEFNFNIITRNLSKCIDELE